jgi:hypothetical protein
MPAQLNEIQWNTNKPFGAFFVDCRPKEQAKIVEGYDDSF